MCEEDAEAQVQEARHAVQTFVAAIGGAPLSSGYVELALQRQKPDIYQKGQYTL